MVSITLGASSVTHDQILHASDIAIRDLLNEPVDPMAMATYLWVYIQRKPAITNGDRLVRWGLAWVRRIFLEGRISRRRDEDMASAALVIASLIDTPSFLEIKDDVKGRVEGSLAYELDRCLVPFRQASYGAIFLLAAHMLGISNPKMTEAALAINQIYTESIFTGRSFGFSFSAKLTKALMNKDSVKELAERIELALIDPATSYEDQVYLLQALWELHDDGTSAHLLKKTEGVVSRVPGRTYQPIQVRDSILVDRESALEPDSNLYRASLLDITTRYNERSALYAEEKFKAEYSGRRGISLLAFSSLALSLSLTVGLLGFYIYRGGQDAKRFWLSGEYSAMSSSSALLYLAVVFLASYLLLITPVILWKTFSLLVISNVQSDKKLLDILKPPILKVSLAWLTIVLLGVVVGIATEVLTQGVQHILR